MSGVAPIPAELAARIVAWRRALHRIPEPSHEEAATAALVAAELEAIGIPFRTGIAGHGVLAMLEGPESGPAVLLRADMDALPIEERTGTAYASEHPGFMHACGHDAHMACLLGALALLKGGAVPLERGRVAALFQPAEEATPGGALRVIRSGVLEEVAPGAVLAQHVDHTRGVGRLAVGEGTVMAQADEFEVLFEGPGGHAAERAAGPDPLRAAARLHAELQGAAAGAAAALGRRNEHSGDTARMLCHVGLVEGGAAGNIVASAAKLRGTTRTFSAEAAAALREVVERCAAETAETEQVDSQIVWRHGAPPVTNDAGLVAACREAWAEGLGRGAVEVQQEPSLAGEDFGHLSRKYPAVYWRLGIRGPRRGGEPWHTDRFDIDEDALAVGAWAMAAAGRAAIRVLALP